jgi:hypothetical protein
LDDLEALSVIEMGVLCDIGESGYVFGADLEDAHEAGWRAFGHKADMAGQDIVGMGGPGRVQSRAGMLLLGASPSVERELAEKKHGMISKVEDQIRELLCESEREIDGRDD